MWIDASAFFLTTNCLELSIDPCSQKHPGFKRLGLHWCQPIAWILLWIYLMSNRLEFVMKYIYDKAYLGADTDP